MVPKTFKRQVRQRASQTSHRAIDFLLILALMPMCGCGESSNPAAPTNQTTPADDTTVPEHRTSDARDMAQDGWRNLFDGTSLDGWKSTPFGGEGEVYVDNGRIMLDFGAPLTGVAYEKDIPKTNYEVRLDAMRVSGSDFFCGLTFPVADSYCSFIVGGWGGGVVGLSSIDGLDASENDTTEYMVFEKEIWYSIRVRVTPKRIQAWIGERQFVDQEITGREVSVRVEVEPSRPFGIAAYDTRAALRNIQIRRLTDTEIQEEEKAADAAQPVP